MEKSIEHQYLEILCDIHSIPRASYLNNLKEKLYIELCKKHNLQNEDKVKLITNNLKTLIEFISSTPKWQIPQYAKGLESILSLKETKEFVDGNGYKIETKYGEIHEDGSIYEKNNPINV